MYYYKARMYAPTLGRFMQTDPIEYGDGMNMYAYVGNDPINGIDPTGLQDVIVVTANRLPTHNFLCSFGACFDEVLGYDGEDDEDGAGEAVGAPQKEETSPCDSTLYRIGEALSYTGDGTTYSGLTIAAIGAPAGGVGAAPGLAITGIGGLIGAAGQAAQDIAFDRPTLEIGARFFANVAGGKVITAVVPRSVRNDLGDAIAETVGEEIASFNPSLSPDRCP